MGEQDPPVPPRRSCPRCQAPITIMWIAGEKTLWCQNCSYKRVITGR